MQRIDGHLSPQQRRAHLQRMADERFDVLVIGGGVTGAGCALDAASRGLATALVEQRDYAAGTSSRSSKLIHGGLRYLAQLQFGLVREALRERELMQDVIAPHLVHPIDFAYPLTGGRLERPYVAAGLTIYDALGRGRHRHAGPRDLQRLAPALAPARGAMIYRDAQVDDARHTLALVRTAAAHGALVANGARVTGIADGRVTVGDEDGGELEIRAAAIINATGVWAQRTQCLATGDPRLRISASKGVHLLIARDRIDLHTNLVIPTATSVLFVIAWGDDRWIVGTTDTGHHGEDLADPAAGPRDVDYLLGQLNRVLREPVTRADVITTYAGLRPLLAGSASPSKLSREHAVVEGPPGLFTVAGGKYTTYRVMARDAVDAAAPQAPPSRTHEIRLLDDAGGPDVATAVTREGARHLDDVLERRIRLALTAPDAGVAAAPGVAREMAPLLGWDEARVAREVDAYVSARRAAAPGG